MPSVRTRIQSPPGAGALRPLDVRFLKLYPSAQGRHEPVALVNYLPAAVIRIDEPGQLTVTTDVLGQKLLVGKG